MNKTIIIVEDDDALRSLLANQLREQGYTAVEAEDGQEALEKIQAAEQPFDLMVSDIRMPRLGGMDLLRKLESCGKTLPTMLLSGTPGDIEATMDQLVRLGVKQVMPKPFDIDVLLQSVAKYVPLPEHQN